MRVRLDDPDHVYRRRWFTLLTLCLSLMVIGLDNTILNVAIPTLAKPEAAGGLGATSSQLQWIVDSYTIVFAGLLLTAGSLGDRFGRYKALTVGLVIFGAGSAASALADSAATLIATRALMGIGGAFIMPATLSVLTNVFTDPAERAKAIGVWAGVSAIGIGLGPMAGGVLLDHFWWGSVFLVNVPIVALGLFAGFAFVPDSADPSAPKLDPLGSVLSIAGLSALLWAIIEGPGLGWTDPVVVAGFVAAAVLLAAFGWWELRCSSPMLDLRFFENPRFSAASGAITVTFLALFGSIFLLTQYLQSVLAYSTVKAGAILVPQALVLMTFAPRSPKLVARFGNKRVVAGGMFVVSASLAAMTTLGVGSTTLHVIAVTVLMGLGMAHIMAPATDSIMGSLPRHKAGVGSAMNDTTRQVGGAVGVAVLGSILSVRYTARLDELVAGLPAASTDAAREGLGATLGVVRALPPGDAVGSALLAAARTAYVDGMHTAVLVGAVAMALAAIGVLRWLPARALPEPAPPADDLVAATAEGTASQSPPGGSMPPQRRPHTQQAATRTPPRQRRVAGGGASPHDERARSVGRPPDRTRRPGHAPKRATRTRDPQ